MRQIYDLSFGCGQEASKVSGHQPLIMSCAHDKDMSALASTHSHLVLSVQSELSPFHSLQHEDNNHLLDRENICSCFNYYIKLVVAFSHKPLVAKYFINII